MWISAVHALFSLYTNQVMGGLALHSIYSHSIEAIAIAGHKAAVTLGLEIVGLEIKPPRFGNSSSVTAPGFKIPRDFQNPNPNTGGGGARGNS